MWHDNNTDGGGLDSVRGSLAYAVCVRLLHAGCLRIVLTHRPESRESNDGFKSSVPRRPTDASFDRPTGQPTSDD